MADMLKELVDPYIGRYDDYLLMGATLNDPLVLAGRTQLEGKFLESYARQPELEELLRKLVVEYAGDSALLPSNATCLVNRARIDAAAQLLLEKGRQPEIDFETYIIDKIGIIQSGQDVKGCILPESAFSIYRY